MINRTLFFFGVFVGTLCDHRMLHASYVHGVLVRQYGRHPVMQPVQLLVGTRGDDCVAVDFFSCAPRSM